MKTFPTLLTLTVAGLSLLAAHAQTGSPALGGATAKLFGEHQTFTATMEYEVADPTTKQPVTMPGKLSFDSGKSRFEMNTAEIKGTQMPAGAAEQLKAMGMDKTVSISRPDKKFSYIIYPGMQSYIESPMPMKSVGTNAADLKMQTTELGKETVDGHECVKNKVVVTNPDGSTQESTVWNAADLGNFPVKVETVEDGQKLLMRFKTVTFEKPDAAAFAVPEGMTKYTSVPAMMQAVMMKQMGGMMARPPGQ